MVLVRAKFGVEIDLSESFGHLELDEPVRAFIFLVSPERQLGAHLRSVAQIGTTVDAPGFVDRWLAAESRTELRSLLVRDERFFQLTVREGGAGGELIGRSLGDLQFPSGALLALVKREGEAFVPSSRDVVQEYDRLTIIGNPDAVQTLRQRFSVDEEPDAEAE